jgi:quinoprotein glucose dehydrogenase
MPRFSEAERVVYYPPDRRFRIWIRPSVLVLLAALVFIPLILAWLQAALHWEGLFTPPGLKPTAHAPGALGGFNWGGLSYDPERGILVGAVNRLGTIVQLSPREEEKGLLPKMEIGSLWLGAEIAPMLDTPYILKRSDLIDRSKPYRHPPIPYTKPPWGTLVGVNLQRSALQFEVPLGTMLDPVKYPEATQWGSPSLGGPMTTAGGLVFMAATMDQHLRAFDIETGLLLWQGDLPAGGQATPMTYMVDGTQYVVQAAGGHAQFGTTLGDYVVAYALPETERGGE